MEWQVTTAQSVILTDKRGCLSLQHKATVARIHQDTGQRRSVADPAAPPSTAIGPGVRTEGGAETRNNKPLPWTAVGSGIPRRASRTPPSLHSPGGYGGAGTRTSLGPASGRPRPQERPPRPAGPPHPRPPGPQQAGTRPTSLPEGPAGFRSACGRTPPPWPESGLRGWRASRIRAQPAAPAPARLPSPGPHTHSPAAWAHSPGAAAALPLSPTLLAARPRDTRTAPARPGPG